MEKVIETSTKYLELKGRCGFLAKDCGCSQAYVFQVLNGHRTPKTDRTKKAAVVLAKADALLALMSDSNTPDDTCNAAALPLV